MGVNRVARYIAYFGVVVTFLLVAVRTEAQSISESDTLTQSDWGRHAIFAEAIGNSMSMISINYEVALIKRVHLRAGVGYLDLLGASIQYPVTASYLLPANLKKSLLWEFGVGTTGVREINPIGDGSELYFHIHTGLRFKRPGALMFINPVVSVIISDGRAWLIPGFSVGYSF